MSTPNHVAYGTTSLGGLASLLAPENIPNAHTLPTGASRADGFPADASYRMNPLHKKDTKLADAIRTSDGDAVPVVSAAMRAVIERFGTDAVEFLPVTLYDLKGAVAGAGYSILNPTTVVDCLNLGAMKVQRNPLDSSSIMSCEGIVLRPAAVADAPAVFRPKGMEDTVVFRRDVADAAQAAGLTGLYFNELANVTD